MAVLLAAIFNLYQGVDKQLLRVDHHGVDQLILVDIEVCELHVSFHIDENDHGFEVTVYDVQVVKVFDRQEDFRSVGPAAFLMRPSRTTRRRERAASRHLLDETPPFWSSRQPYQALVLK